MKLGQDLRPADISAPKYARLLPKSIFFSCDVPFSNVQQSENVLLLNFKKDLPSNHQ